MSAARIEPLHVERHGDQQVRARPQSAPACRPGVVDKLATTQTSPMLLRLPAALRIRAVDVRREQPVASFNVADELDVVVVVGGGVLLHAPRRVDHAEIDVVRRVRLAVGAVAVRPGFELREHLRETTPPTRAIAQSGFTLMPSILVVDRERLRRDAPGDEQIARADRRVGGHVHGRRSSTSGVALTTRVTVMPGPRSMSAAVSVAGRLAP